MKLLPPPQHTGRQVTWKPFPAAKVWQVWEVNNPDIARRMANLIAEIHSGTYQPDQRTPFWALTVAWMRHGGPLLSSRSFPSYAIDIRRINSIIGDRPLSACNLSLYERVWEQLDLEDASESQRRSVHRTLKAICTWAQGHDWWREPAEMFGHRSNRQKAAKRAFEQGAAADIRLGRKKNLIDLDDCPQFDETYAFAQTFGAVCVDRWGEGARYLGDQPIVHYLAGLRWGETLAVRPENYRRNARSLFVPTQIDLEYPYIGFHPTEKPTKGGKERNVPLWGWSLDELDRIFSDAVQHDRTFVFQSPKEDLRTFPRQLLSAYQDAQAEADYVYSSHFHRHAYATTMLATKSEGGYDRSIKSVAAALGHRSEDVTGRYVHVKEAVDDGWSDERPGKRT